MRRMQVLRLCGWPGAAKRLYRRCAWTAGLGVILAMLLQEGILWRSGQLTWQTGLPLHLCSLMGVVTLPMLLTGNAWLWHFALYAGMPGAALALVFPAVMATPWPRWTAFGFYTMHALLVFAPLLPLGLGRKPACRGAAQAWLMLLTAGVIAMVVNALAGSNYLFLAYPLAGTPLTLLARDGLWRYRLNLAVLSALVMALEGCTVLLRTRKKGHVTLPKIETEE